ncbi:MAG: HAD family hydrolase [Alphaproteobacteria bacterium]|nr:HAD family hydrolase [Alphaproteobacteria bacterium]
MTTAALHKALFLDRDGVLNVDTGYPHRVEDLVMIDGADRAVAMAHAAGYKVFIVTNQGGIALNYFTEEDMTAFHDHMVSIINKGGGVITDIAFCPHHPKSPDPGLRECDCRKPQPNMILDLARRHNIDLTRSLMVGDRESDIAAGQAAGCPAHLFEGGRLDDFISPLLRAAS